MHALVERRPGVIAGKVAGRQGRRVRAIEIGVLHVDDEQRHLALFEHRFLGLRGTLVVEGTAFGLPAHAMILMLPPGGGAPA
ncbi:hypothetical protein D3C87_1762350 [compost metagenome]